MKSFAKICGWMMFLLCATQSFAQGTYGSIAPLGGVTASINQEMTFTYPNKTGASYYWSAYPSSTAIPSSAVEFTSSVTSSTVKIKFKQAMIAFVCVVRYQPGAQPAHECISFNVVNCNTLPTPTSLTGPLTVDVCLPEVTYTTTTVVGATSYEWTGLLSGNRITPGPTLTIAGNEFKIGNNAFRVRARNECGGYSAYYSRTIKGVNTATPGAISGPALVDNCATTSYTYSTTTVTSAAGYVWSGFDGGSDTTSVASITLPGNVFATGTTTLSVQVLNNCGSLTTATTLTISSTVLGTPSTITGPTTVANCGSNTYTYSIGPVSNATSYSWSGFSTGTKTSTTPELIANASDFATGTSTISVKAINVCGSESTATSINVSSQSLGTPTSITGPALLCGVGGTYATQAIPGAINYRWTGLVSGLKTTSIPSLIVAPSDFTLGATANLAVSAIDACGNASASVSMTVKYSQLGTLSAITGPTVIPYCGGASSQSFNVAPIVDATSYSWTSTLGLTNAPSPSPNTMVVVDPFRLPGYSYQVSVTATTICGTTNPVNLSGLISNIPPLNILGPPQINCSGATFSVPSLNCGNRPINYRWYVDGSFITTGPEFFLDGNNYINGSTIDIRVERLSGSQVIDQVTSFVSINCIGLPFSIQPNPTQQSFTIEKEIEAPEEEVIVNLLSIDGTQISTTKSKSKKIEIDSERLQPGAYLVEIIANGKREVRRVVKE